MLDRSSCKDIVGLMANGRGYIVSINWFSNETCEQPNALYGSGQGVGGSTAEGLVGADNKQMEGFPAFLMKSCTYMHCTHTNTSLGGLGRNDSFVYVCDL
jgi:hypothetical protein